MNGDSETEDGGGLDNDAAIEAGGALELAARCGPSGGIAASSTSGAAAVDWAVDEHGIDARKSPYVALSDLSASSEGLDA